MDSSLEEKFSFMKFEDSDAVFPSSTIRFSNIDCIIQPKDGVGGLYLGNKRGADSLVDLLLLKVSAVLTVAARCPVNYDPDFMPNHKIIDALDTDDYDLSQFFDEGVQFIHENMKTGNVFVHCFAGVSRSVAMVTAYLIQEQKMELQEASKLIREKRWVAGPNEGFMKQLADFEKKLKIKQTSDDAKPSTDESQAKVLKDETTA